MNKIEIPGNKKTKAKIFEVGKIYKFLLSSASYDNAPVIARLVDIKNNQIFFETVFSKKIFRASAKQHGLITKTAESINDDDVKNQIFDDIFISETFNQYYVL